MHTSTTNQRLKVHCGIPNPDGVSMHIANDTVQWQRGRCVLLEDSWEHELSSESWQRPRTIVELKLPHPDVGPGGAPGLSLETGLPVRPRRKSKKRKSGKPDTTAETEL